MQATFQMKHNYYKNMNLNTTETPNGKYVMAGANPVMARFFNNGFSVYINPYPERFRKEKVNFSQKWNGKIDKKMDVELKKQDIYWFLQYIETIFSNKKYLSYIGDFQIEVKPKKIKKLNFSEKKVIKNSEKTPFLNSLSNIKDDKVKFVYLHNTIMIDPKPCIKFGKNGYRDGYIEQIECANQDIKGSIEYILRNDPNSIIIIQADHGRGPDTRNIDYGDGSVMIKKYGIEKYIEKGNNIQKRFGILFAVKWPKKCKYLGKEKYTPINLFPRVFACLNGEKPNYNSMAADDSYLIGAWSDEKNRKRNEVFKVIQSNQILPEYKKSN